MNLELSPIDGEAVRKVVAQMQATPPDVIAAVQGRSPARRISAWPVSWTRCSVKRSGTVHR